MKCLIASDIHGSAYWTERLIEAIEAEAPDRVLLLGDILYHGPRNDLPKEYDPKRVALLLNVVAQQGTVLAVRGNCDSEVDQMMLEFPCMADYAQLVVENGQSLFLTHGHIYGPGLHASCNKVPPLPKNSALLYGHTHIKVNKAAFKTKEGTVLSGKSTSRTEDGNPHSEEKLNAAENPSAIENLKVAKRPSTVENLSSLWLFNPGSISLPKDGTHSYGIYESDVPFEEAFRHVVIS